MNQSNTDWLRRAVLYASVVFGVNLWADSEVVINLPYFLTAADISENESIARVINHSSESGDIQITAIDEEGTQYEDLALSLGANQTIHLRSSDIENGNADKGLTGSVGTGQGSWRLKFESQLDFEVLTYVVASDGSLSAMHDIVPQDDALHRVGVFYPADDQTLKSELRIVNRGDEVATVKISGIDDSGSTPGSGVTLSIPAGASRHYTASELESGNAARFEGDIGDGSGKWRLTIESQQSIVALSLLRGVDGYLTNLSTLPESDESSHQVPFFPSAHDDDGVSGLLRVSNMLDQSGEISIQAFDESGVSFDALTLSIGANESHEITAMDLETGNEDAGLSGSLGEGIGDWRLILTSDLSIRVLTFVTNMDSNIASVHDDAPATRIRHRIPTFNVRTNGSEQSFLKLANLEDEIAEVTIGGTDRHGSTMGGLIRVTVPANGVRTLSARQLEYGHADFEGAFGYRGLVDNDPWRLTVQANRSIAVLSLLVNSNGRVTNLSTAPQRGAGPYETASEAYALAIETIVQSKCVLCHFSGGVARNSDLIFQRGSSNTTLTNNLREFEDYVLTVVDGEEQILAKIQGDASHGGGVVVRANTPEFRSTQRFLTLLGREKEIRNGTVAAKSNGTNPVDRAQCEFTAIGLDGLGSGRVLVSTDATRNGRFTVRTPAKTEGYLVCTPRNMTNAALFKFVPTTSVSADERHVVSPRSTVAALVLAMALLRDPKLDVNARGSRLENELLDRDEFNALVNVADELYSSLLSNEADVSFVKLLLDAFGNGQIDDTILETTLVQSLNRTLDDVASEMEFPIYSATTSTFDDFLALASAHGVADPAPAPAIAADPDDIANVAAEFQTPEFARNPALFHMNAHWAYARGLTGAGGTIGIVDTGLYAAHEEFDERLHDEAVYTVLGDDTDGDGWPQYSYYKVGELDPKTAYPDAEPESNSSCQGVFCKFYEYQHGTLMSSVAVGARNEVDAHGLAYGANLIFRPSRQQGTLIGTIYYHPPGEITQPWLVSRHDIVRQVGESASVVSNSWLTGRSSFLNDSFDEVLTPRYLRHQRNERATVQTVYVWSAGNIPESAGPIVDGAAVPSLSERQIRVLTDGERGLADYVLSENEKLGLSAAQALRHAENVQESLRRRWLTVVALISIEDNPHNDVRCIENNLTDTDECALTWALLTSARCGFASDWCVAVGPSVGGVETDLRNPPNASGRHRVKSMYTSEGAAIAGAAYNVVSGAYRSEDAQLTLGSNSVLKRLKETAKQDILNPDAKYDWDRRNVLIREEEMIRSLLLFAGSTNEELLDLMWVTRQELNADRDGTDYEAPESLVGAKKGDRYRIFNRFSPYWATMQTGIFRDMLNRAHDSEHHRRDVLARLIRQIEWIDEQLHRLDKTKDTVTESDVRRIALTSLIGHGLVDLKAATDPAQ